MVSTSQSDSFTRSHYPGKTAHPGGLRLFGPGVELEPIPGLREVDEYHLPTVLVGKRRGCISKIVHALPARMVGGSSADTVAPALRRAFTRSRCSPPPDLAKHGTTAVGGIASATPRCAGVPAARSGKQSGIRPDAQDGTRRPACVRPSHRNRLWSASRCAACFPGSPFLCLPGFTSFRRSAGMAAASGGPIGPNSGSASWSEGRNAATPPAARSRDRPGAPRPGRPGSRAAASSPAKLPLIPLMPDWRRRREKPVLRRAGARNADQERAERFNRSALRCRRRA